MSFVHVTKDQLVDDVLRDGLRIGMPPDLTSECAWALRHYGNNPVFLCRLDSDFYDGMSRFGYYGVRPHVDVDTGVLDIVADLAALIDHGGGYEADRGRIRWRNGREPPAMTLFLDRRSSVAISRLLDPTDPACCAAIELTGTAACMGDIPPNRLSLRTVIAARMG